MSFGGEPTQERAQRRFDADRVECTMQWIDEHLRVEMRRSQAGQEEAANRGRIPVPNVQECTRLWLDAPHVRTTRPTQKLDWKRLGPFKVSRRISPYANELELPAFIRIHRVPPISLLDLVVDDPLIGQQGKPAPPVEVDGEEEYQVSKVKNSRMDRNQLQYLIQWTGYDSLTWEPVKFMDGLQAVEDFHQLYPQKPGPLENVLGGPRT